MTTSKLLLAGLRRTTFSLDSLSLALPSILPRSPDLLRPSLSSLPPSPLVRTISLSPFLSRESFERKAALAQTIRSVDDGTSGELSLTHAEEVRALEEKAVEDREPGDRRRVRPLDFMPRPEDYEKEYDGIKYVDLPIMFLNASKNNTKIAMMDSRFRTKMYTSAGVEGFLRKKRGTNIAAQTAAMSFAKRLVRQVKIKHVRVIVRGRGAGRLSGVQGLVMGGLNVVSISDESRVYGIDPGDSPGPRPRKVRRV